MSELNIGVIGSGGRGSLATHAHQPENGVRITACCDVSPEAFETNKKNYGDDILTTDSPQAIIDSGVDAIIIASPDFLHEEHGALALEAGIPIYLEKPMTITIDGCDRLLRIAHEKNVKLMVGHNMRYMAIIRKMKQLIDDGVIGEVKAIWCRHFISYGGDAYFRDWHAERKYSTGLLLQKGAHDIDVMHLLAGRYTKRVSAFGSLTVYDKQPRRDPNEKWDSKWYPKTNWPATELKDFNPVIDVEDQTVMNMDMGDGVMGSYMQCHFTPDSCRNYTVIGTRGRIENIGNSPESQIYLWNQRTDQCRTVGDQVFRGEQPTSTDGHGGADSLIMQGFIDYIRDDKEPDVSPEAARMSVAAGYLATMSLRDGGTPQDIPPLPDFA